MLVTVTYSEMSKLIKIPQQYYIAYFHLIYCIKLSAWFSAIKNELKDVNKFKLKNNSNSK